MERYKVGYKGVGVTYMSGEFRGATAESRSKKEFQKYSAKKGVTTWYKWNEYAKKYQEWKTATTT